LEAVAVVAVSLLLVAVSLVEEEEEAVEEVEELVDVELLSELEVEEAVVVVVLVLDSVVGLLPVVRL